MSRNFFDYLKNVGISDKEIAVYLYLLSVESALPMDIAKETRLKRSTVYVVLDFLKEKGLVFEIQRGKRSAYAAESPERIKFLLEELKLKTEQSIKNIDAIMPQLKATLRRKGEPPLVKILEGEAAVQASMEELASNPAFRANLDYGIFPFELIHKLFSSRHLRQYIDFRIRDNKHFKVLYTSDEGEIPTDGEGQEAVRIDNKLYPLSCDISIFEDEVRIHMLGKDMHGILIKNQELAETLVSIFKLALKGTRGSDESATQETK